MNANPEVPVQMVMPELNAGQSLQNENATSSAQSTSVMHSSMTMAQSPLQQQMQAMQQNMNSNSTGPVQMVMSELNTQVQMVQNENIAHSHSSTQQTLMHPTVTMAQAPMQHVQVIPQAMSTPYFQSVYSPQQQVIFPGNLTLHTGGAPMVQSIAQNPNVQLQAKPELLNKVSVTGPTYQIVNAVTTKGFPTQNLIAKPMYSSSVAVNSPTQVSNANQLKQMTSQPQMITTQASSGAIYQPQIFGPFTQLPQNLTWATPGAYQSPTLLSNVIIRNQQPEMYIQPSGQTAMLMPVGTGATQLQGGFTYALVQPQKPQQITQKHLSIPQAQLQKTMKNDSVRSYLCEKFNIPQAQLQKTMKVRNISPSVATQTNTNEKMKIAIPRTRVNQNIIRPKGKITVPVQYNATISTVLPQQIAPQVATDTQNQVQLGFQLESINQMDANSQVLQNIAKSTSSTETDSVVLQNQLLVSESTQSMQHMSSQAEVINVQTAQIANSPISKPVAMVIASTLNTTLSVNSPVSSPTITTPTLAPVVSSVSSVETPASVAECVPASCPISNDTNVLDSASNSVPLPETNNTNEENVNATFLETDDNICEPVMHDNLETNSSICDQITASKIETTALSSDVKDSDTLQSHSSVQVNTNESKATNISKPQTCDSGQQTIFTVIFPPVNEKKLAKLKSETQLLSNMSKTDEQQDKMNDLRPDVSVPDVSVNESTEKKEESDKDKTKFDLDIEIKKEPDDSSPAKVTSDINFKTVAQKEVIVNQADSSVVIQNDHVKHQSYNLLTVQSKTVQHNHNFTLPVESNTISDSDTINKTIETEINCNVTTDNNYTENQTNDSIIHETKTEKFKTEIIASEKLPTEDPLVIKELKEKDSDDHLFKNFGNTFIEQEIFSGEQSGNVLQNAISPSHTVGKQKQRLKAVVRPHILTHVIDGFVIYESSEPFPVNKSALMSDSCAPVVPKIADGSKKHKNSKNVPPKNPDEPTKPDDLKEPNEPSKTDFPKKRSDRIKLMETQKQLDLKKSEPKKSNDLKRANEPKTPTEKKAPFDIKKLDEPKKSEDPKKIEESHAADNVSPSDLKKPNQGTPESIPKTPGRRGRKRKELRSRRGRKKLIPDGEMNSSNIEIIVLDDEKGLESDGIEDESTSALDTSPTPLQIATEDEIPKSPIENCEKSPVKESAIEKAKDVEDDKSKSFSEKLPTEWSIDDVCDFVTNLPNFQDYAEEFRREEIDGKALLLLNVDHIVKFTNMKFGPALKLISIITDMKEKYSLEV